MEGEAPHRKENPVRVVLLSPGGAIRTGLRSLLQSGGWVEIVQEMTHPADLSAVDETVEVLVVVLPPREWIELDKHLPPGNPLAVLLLVRDWEEAGSVPLPPIFYNRAVGLLPLEVEEATLLAAVGALVEGLSVGLPGWFNRLTRPGGMPASAPAGEENLTPREVDVLEQLAQGLTNKQIALALGISEHTVKYHISAVYAKLGVMNRAEAVRVGARRGYLKI